tara:strand:- start:3507 stop:4754 length:1248 start_codon:yes stop_codon:yes gene_type:complete
MASSANTAREGDRGTVSTNDHWHGDRWQDRVPREPMWMISAGNGERSTSFHPEDNPIGLARWWRGENAVDNLLGRIRIGYNAGARWFFINRPMGTLLSGHVPAASWLTIDDQKREELPRLLTDALLDEFEDQVNIVWFIGSDLRDPRDNLGWSQSRGDQYFQIGQSDNWKQLISTRTTLGGWISTGASGIAIDHSAPTNEREHFINLFKQLNQPPFNLAIYGEGYPIEGAVGGGMARGSDGAPYFNQHAIDSMAWIATDSNIEYHWPINQNDFDAFPLDEDDTRLFVWITDDYDEFPESYRIELMHKYMDRGLIPMTGDKVMFQTAVNRLRLGMPRPIADEGSDIDINVASDEQNDDGEAGFGYASTVAGGGGGGAGALSSAPGVSGGRGQSLGTSIITVRGKSASATEHNNIIE